MVISLTQKEWIYQTCGLYYKHATIVNDDSGVISMWSSKLIDNARAVIYDRHMLNAQAIELKD
jgi:hypothetical protein